MKEALIIVDVQNDFCPGGALPVPDGDKVVEPLNRMIYLAERKDWLRIASRDWHPKQTLHFAKYNNDGKGWPEHCIAGTKGAEFHSGLMLSGYDPVRGEDVIIFSKGMGYDENAYSAFDGIRDDNPTWNLENFLNLFRKEKLYIGGLATDYCVKATALDAVKKGFDTYLLLDAIAAVNISPDDGDKAIKEMVEAGVRLTTVDLVIRKYLGNK